MLLHIRRIVGDSMRPALRPKQIVIAIGLFRNLQAGDIVIVQHQGVEKIKRIKFCTADHIFIVGDNSESSIDSRHFGLIPRSAVVGKVVWPTTDQSGRR